MPDFLIYSDGGRGELQTYLINTKTKSVGALTIPTLAEKCAKGIFANGIFCASPKNLDNNYIAQLNSKLQPQLSHIIHIISLSRPT